MISYAPLWRTMKQRGVSTYALISQYGFSRGTLDRLKQTRNVTTNTLDDLFYFNASCMGTSNLS